MDKKETVLVAMSGGVDSSVTAALLKERGYRLIGATMQLGTAEGGNAENPEGCGKSSAIEDARKVAASLDIPFHVIDFQELFQNKVIDYFIRTYLRGITPNPCIMCNRHLKFAALMDKALELGADYLATGHYARVAYDQTGKRYELKRAADESKDQSYVLYNLTQEKLSRVMLPLGDYSKPQIREMAKKLGLTVAEKPESQEICFITDNDYRRFMTEKAGSEIHSGDFVDLNGKVIGRHQGLPFYTIGQRKGLGLALGKPAYVVDIDPEKNAVVIGEADDLLRDSLVASDNNFILIDRLTEPMEVTVKIRYKSEDVPAVISPLENGQVLVKFKENQRAITPGQGVVYYLGDRVLGGGTIQ